MNWLDVVIILVIAWFTFAAFTAGIIREVVTFVATILAIVIAGLYYDDLARDVLVFIDNEATAFVVAFLVLLASVFLMGQLVAFLLKRAASFLMLGWADHLAGAGFGLLKGLMMVEIILILFVTYPRLGLDDTIDGSALAPAFLDAVPVLVRILPGEFDDAVDSFPPPEA